MSWHTITTAIPAQAWAIGLAATVLLTAILLPVARRLAYKAGARAASRTAATDRRDRNLLIGTLIPAFALLGAVLAGSQRGLLGFGRDTLHWRHGWEYLVPATLDGVGLAFAFLAFRAVRKRRSPDRAVRIAWGAALASAVINFGHESGIPGGSRLGGAYLALLSLLVMVMFHELLDQFSEGTEYIRRDNPAFKLRWLTWPTNTVCAWIAWRNYPVADGTPATVAAAVAHLDEVRAAKRTARLARITEPAPWWAPAVPWRRMRDLGAALTEHRTAAEAERAEHADRITLLEAERSTLRQMVERYRSEAEQAVGHLTAERTEREVLHRLLTEAEQVTTRTARTEHPERSTAAGAKQPRTAVAANAPKLTDDEALRAMLRAHPKADFEWTKREVHRITGAGFGRVDRLIAAVAEHHRQQAERSSDDPKEEAV